MRPPVSPRALSSGTFSTGGISVWRTGDLRRATLPVWSRLPQPSSVRRGVNLMKVCDQTGHKSLEMRRVYTRDAELFAGNAAAGLL